MILKRTNLIILTLTAFLIGLILANFGAIPSPYWPIMVGAGLIVSIWTKGLKLAILLTLIGLILGLWRGGLTIKNEQIVSKLIGHKTTFVGKVSDDPAQNLVKKYVSFALVNPTAQGRKITARFYVISYDLKLQRGQQIQLTAKPKTGFANYQATLIASDLKVTQAQVGKLEQWRRRFFASVQTTLPEPLSGLALGLLVGNKTFLPKALQAELVAVGLAHLIAVSGYNLTIIINAVRRWLGFGSKFLRTALSLWLIALFVVIAGASASIIRAAIVSGLILLGDYYGRTIKPLVVVLIAAVLTAGYNPEFLWHDVGWQLSFLAFFGITVVAPLVASHLRLQKSVVGRIVIESLAAQLFTLPLIMLDFKQLSVVSPLANAIILPLVPAAMLFSFVAGVAGLVLPLVAGFLAWPAIYLLKLMLAIIHLLAGWSWSSLTIGLSVLSAVIIYATLAVLAGIFRRRRKPAETAII